MSLIVDGASMDVGQMGIGQFWVLYGQFGLIIEDVIMWKMSLKVIPYDKEDGDPVQKCHGMKTEKGHKYKDGSNKLVQNYRCKKPATK